MPATPIRFAALRSYLPWLLALVAAGIGLRLLHVSDGGYWLDELWSMLHSAPEASTGTVIQSALTDHHPPLYDVLLHGWLVLFPQEFSARWLSVVLGIAGVWLTGIYARNMYRSRLAVFIVVGLVSLSYFHIIYSIEARYYALLYVLALGFVSHTILYLRDCKRRQLLWAFLFALALAYTHLYGAILVAAAGGALLVLWLLRRMQRAAFLKFALLCVLVLLCLAPVLPALLGGAAGGSWMQPPGAGAFFEYTYEQTGKNPVEFLFLMVPLVGVFARLRRQQPAHIFMACCALLCFLIPFILSLLVVPMLHFRYTMVYYPAMLLLAAGWWAALKMAVKWKAGIIAVVFLSSVLNLCFVNGFVKHYPREPWREMAIAATSTARAKPEPVYSSVSLYFNYYFRRLGADTALPVQAFGQDSAFVLLRTPYQLNDSIPLTRMRYQRTSVQDFGGAWKVEYYKASTP